MKYGSITSRVIEICASKEGATLQELCAQTDRSNKVVMSILHPLMERCDVVRVGVRPLSRYFSDTLHALGYAARLPQLIAENEKKKKALQKECSRRASQKREARRRAEREELRAKNGLPPRAKKPRLVKIAPKKTSVVISSKAGELQNKKDHIAATIVWPENVKVQVVPGYRGDTRFKFTPEPGWRGAITEDWMNRRMAANC